MEVFCKLTVLHLPGAKKLCRTHKIFAKKLERRKGSQIFLQNTSIFARRPKKFSKNFLQNTSNFCQEA